jgi:hypothetical protein
MVTPMRLRLVPSLALIALLAAAPAVAQPPPPNRAEPWRGPLDPPGTQPSTNRARVSSGEGAAQPTAAEQRQARTLAAAVFATPAAAHQAADNTAPEATPDWAAAQPRAEWTDKTTGIVPGGRGMKITAPF